MVYIKHLKNLSTYPYIKITVENSSCGTETAVDGPGPPKEYIGWTNIVDALGLINLYTMDPLVLPLDLSNVVANDVSKLSMINTSGGGGGSFPVFSLLCPGRINYGAGFIPG